MKDLPAHRRLRPAFRLNVACGISRLKESIETRLQENHGFVEGEFSARHGVLRVPKQARRFWTPYLEITLEEGIGSTRNSDPDRSELWGTFSPRPEIWTGFIFAIGTLVVVSIFATIYGFAQFMLNQTPVALWIPVIAVFSGILLYAAALIGQGLSIAEMYRIRAFVDDCIRAAEARPPHDERT